MIKDKADLPEPSSPEQQRSTPPGGVRLQKREPAAPEAEKVREKLCSRCGAAFKLDPGKKFYLCPDCYRREVLYKRHGSQVETRVMALVTCSACGKEEYLPFTPEDRDKALCRTCFAEAKAAQKEQNPPRRHSR